MRVSVCQCYVCVLLYRRPRRSSDTYSVLYITYVVTARFSGVTLKTINIVDLSCIMVGMHTPNNIMQHLLLPFLSTSRSHLPLCSSLIISPLMAILLRGCVSSLLIAPSAFLPVLSQCCLSEIVSSMPSFFFC